MFCVSILVGGEISIDSSRLKDTLSFSLCSRSKEKEPSPSKSKALYGIQANELPLSSLPLPLRMQRPCP